MSTPVQLAPSLLLDESHRRELWQHVVNTIESYISQVGDLRVAPPLDPTAIRKLLMPLQFDQPLDAVEAIDFIADGLRQYQVHNPHPRYFGLYNPSPTTMSIYADALVAAFNPQLAAWSHSPLAIEIENHLIRTFAEKFGYDPASADGTFTSGGAEANHTGVLTALVRQFPSFATGGVRSLPAQPVMYLSAQAHHSFQKAVRLCGLGSNAVREIPVNDQFQLDVNLLREQIKADRLAGLIPFLVVGTAGTTSGGIVDPLVELAELCHQEKLYFHVDAAWGGAAVFLDELKPLLKGIALADSITFDAHKWFSVPMAAGIYLTRHPGLLTETFATANNYMPIDARGLEVIDPYAHSMQWSRRFIGLKVFLSLLVAGWEGYAVAIRHQTEMGQYLRHQLASTRWKVVNQTSLPVVCFVDGVHPEGTTQPYLERVASRVLASGNAWISTTTIAPQTPVLRACITNFRTQPEDIQILIEALETTCT